MGKTELSVKRLQAIAKELGIKPAAFFENAGENLILYQNNKEIENNHPVINVGKTNEKLIEMLENTLKDKQQTIDNLLKQNEILINLLQK